MTIEQKSIFVTPFQNLFCSLNISNMDFIILMKKAIMRTNYIDYNHGIHLNVRLEHYFKELGT